MARVCKSVKRLCMVLVTEIHYYFYFLIFLFLGLKKDKYSVNFRDAPMLFLQTEYKYLHLCTDTKSICFCRCSINVSYTTVSGMQIWSGSKKMPEHLLTAIYLEFNVMLPWSGIGGIRYRGMWAQCRPSTWYWYWCIPSSFKSLA